MNICHALAGGFLLCLLAHEPLVAQVPVRLDLGGNLEANGEGERYLRVLQLLGQVPAHPVGVRPWNRAEVRALSSKAGHPWKERFVVHDSAASPFRVLRPQLRLTGNSALPEGNDPVWFGRGVTVDAVLGVRASFGFLDIQLAPGAFWAQNASFTPAPNSLSGDGALRDARYPGNVDAPQRFGTGAYTRVDPGQSRVAIDTRAISAGISTAPLAWGPARDEPVVVGPNGGGFPHAFFGSGTPWPVGVGRVHFKMVAGRLEQSEWSPVQAGYRSRLGVGVVATFVPRGVPGLELGAVRFEHRAWKPGVFTFANATRPFTGIFNNFTSGINQDENGYASLFFRWAAAPHGFEVYGEYGREDYTGNTRWLILKPDDLGNLMLGVQRALLGANGRVRVYRAELVNAELSSNERGQRGFTAPIPPYTHGGTLQGHTVNGRFLGSATAYGGAGWRVARDTYSGRGRRSVVVERQLLKDWLPVAVPAEGRTPEVRYGVRGEWLRFLSGQREVGAAVGVSYTLNHNTKPHQDVANLQASLRWRGW
ncbi:MAG: hypothetical protein FJ363_09410 [Gemmatimonadetes bacterium]|nr:hypothetical protein [Gemmatimonadota bacterium]